MLFSDLFGVRNPDRQSWFDPILNSDTRLFVDPFLIYKEQRGPWATAHNELIAYFDRGFRRLAGYQDRPGSLPYRKVVRMMTFPEPREFCLGYVGEGTRGSGTGKGFAYRIVEAMGQAIDRGLRNMRHFEELGVLVEKINRDRISDITCNILRPRFISYTQRVCRRLDIKTESIELQGARFDDIRDAWLPAVVQLPRNPFNGRAVLLTPKRFLAELPRLNAEDWWEYAESTLRDDLNLDIMSNVKRSEIIRLARERPDLVRDWSESAEGSGARPYNIDRDPAGLHSWDATTRRYVNEHPMSLLQANNSEELSQVIREIVRRFKLFVEEQRGWSLLYNDDTGRPKREEAVQLLFKGIVAYYCEANSIRLDREVYLGRGPVDFIFSTNFTSRVLMEVKKMTNSDYWHGLERQLISYLTSDECKYGWFLAVRYDDSDKSVERTRDLSDRTSAAASSTGFDLKSDWVDARPKSSASKM